MKIKVLVSYYEMMVGGSTTSLIAFLNNIDKSRYEVHLQLYRNHGVEKYNIPKDVVLLPEAELYKGKTGQIVKFIKLLFSGALFKVIRLNKRYGANPIFGRALVEYQAKLFSRKNKIKYDYAVGYLEGWSNKYVAYSVRADVKYCWLHSSFANLAPIPELEIPWIKKVDKVVFVANNCTKGFCEILPEYADKAVTIMNITDSNLVREKAENADETDDVYLSFKSSEAFKIITVARTEISTKGLDRTIECAKKLKENGNSFMWMIVGDGRDFDKFKRMIQEADVSDCVFAVGRRNNPCPFIKAADVFCMLSRYEGMPMAVTESMILGVPPIVTSYSSAHEQINNGIDGIIVENSDDSAYYELNRCIDCPDVVRKMKEYLLNHDYGNNDYMREIENVYFS